jgi:UDP-N-acetylglucosamine 2-epimerase
MGKRCVTLRAETEWVELVEAGANHVVGTDPDAIRAAVAWASEPVAAPAPLYGNGDAAEQMARILLDARPR